MKIITAIILFLNIGLSYALTKHIGIDFSYKGDQYQVRFTEYNFFDCMDALEKYKHTNDGNYVSYVSNYPCSSGLNEVAKQLKSIIKWNNFNKLDSINLIINFVRGIPYTYDKDSTGMSEYVRYPYETIMMTQGDCEDHAILFAALMSKFCFNSVFIDFDEHLAVGVDISSFSEPIAGVCYELNGSNYYFCESTPCGSPPCGERLIGEHPIWEYSNKKSDGTANKLTLIPKECSYSINPIRFGPPIYTDSPMDRDFLKVPKPSKAEKLFLTDWRN